MFGVLFLPFSSYVATPGDFSSLLEGSFAEEIVAVTVYLATKPNNSAFFGVAAIVRSPLLRSFIRDCVLRCHFGASGDCVGPLIQ